jgi:hypothetical protein
MVETDFAANWSHMTIGFFQRPGLCLPLNNAVHRKSGTYVEPRRSNDIHSSLTLGLISVDAARSVKADKVRIL